MTRWLEEILAFSDLSLENLEKDKELLEVNSLVKTATELLSPIGQGKIIAVDFQSKDLLPTILGNKRWLQRAVENLITNAFKYTPDDGKIEIKTGYIGFFLSLNRVYVLFIIKKRKRKRKRKRN